MALNNKTALVTGGSRGLGRAIATKLASEKCNVAILDRREEVGAATIEKINSTPGYGKAIFIRCDVMVDEDIQNAYDEVESKFGSLDIVVHNAGINNVKDEGFRNWRGQLGVNLGGIFEGTRVAKGKLRANGVGGVIINIASITGLVPERSIPVYSATKWGVVGFTRGLQHWRKQKIPIRVACVCPTLILTEGGKLQQRTNEAQGIPLTDPGIEPEEVAACVYNLINGNLNDEPVVAIGPKGSKIETLWNDQFLPRYSKEMYFNNGNDAKL